MLSALLCGQRAEGRLGRGRQEATSGLTPWDLCPVMAQRRAFLISAPWRFLPVSPEEVWTHVNNKDRDDDRRVPRPTARQALC